jgi:DUF4097 and DUF4098 domain-containing protein YvlB
MESIMKLKYYLVLSFVLLLLSTASAECRYNTHYFGGGDLKVLHEKTFKISSGKELILEASVGDIFITAWDKDEVYIKVSGNEKAEEKIDFTFHSNNQKVEVTAKKEGSFFNWFGSGIALKFEIKVPNKFNNKVRASGGDIRLAGVSGNNSLKTSGGDLWIKNTNGELKISTSGGDINLDDNKGNISAATSGGDINARSFEGNFSVSTSGGDIKLKGANSKIDASTSGGDIQLEYRGENKGINLTTSGGDIYIKVPEDFSASVKLATSGGDISSAIGVNNVKKKSPTKLEGELNRGGFMLNATTSGGDIVVGKL